MFGFNKIDRFIGRLLSQSNWVNELIAVLINLRTLLHLIDTDILISLYSFSQAIAVYCIVDKRG